MTSQRRTQTRTHPCSKCGGPREGNHAYCNRCRARYMREYRKTHPLAEEHRKRDSARSYAGVYLRRGKLIRQPCEDCGLEHDPLTPIEMHHEDYDKPLEVTWLCRDCHLDRHSNADGEILASDHAGRLLSPPAGDPDPAPEPPNRPRIVGNGANQL